MSGSTSAMSRWRKSCPIAANNSSWIVLIGFAPGAILLDNSARMANARRLLVWTAVAIAFALVARFGFFFFRDNFSTSYPLKVISAASYRAGEIPYWNFHDSGGQPLAGSPGAQTFYPDNVLYLFLPAHVA